MHANNWGGCITDANPGQISPGELQLPSWTLTTGLNIYKSHPPPAFLLSSPPPPPAPPPPAVQTGQYRAAAGLSGFSREEASSTSGSGASSSSSRVEAEVEEQQPASSKWPASSTSSLLQAVDTADSCLGIEDTSREAEDTAHTKDICWAQLTHREDTYCSQKSREESLLATRKSFEISGREKEAEEETYWTYRRDPEVGVEVNSRRELGREGALGGRMSSRYLFSCSCRGG